MGGRPPALPETHAMSSHDTQAPAAVPEREDFIREIVKADLGSGRVRDVVTRFPPEPNGHLHVGHAKAICLNFGIARQFGGRCNLRMDDTNPAREEIEYVDSILADVKWLVAGWADDRLGLRKHDGISVPYYASDYFGALHDFAVRLIETGKALPPYKPA